jgi:threonine 3-dehydrogenase
MKTIPALTFDTKLDGWEKSKGFTKREIPMPALDEKRDSPDALSVLIGVKYAGLCGTDRGIWNREVFRELIHNSLKRERKSQRILGHEFVGKVVQAGSQILNLYGIKKGDDVSGDSHVTCGRCFQCRVGEEEVCQDQAILGIGIDGVFAKYIKIPAKNLWQVDFTRVRPELASMFDPFGNAVHACSKVDLRGQRIAILGCGPIGMFAILLARAFGAAKVVAIDTNKANLAMAKRLGAHNTVLVGSGKRQNAYDSDADLQKAIDQLTYGKGVDIAFEMAGPNSSVNNALAITRSGGHIVLFGLKDGDFVLPHFNRAIVKGLTLHGVIGRKIFETWQISQRVLSDKQNGIQDKIWRIIMKSGKDTIVPLSRYTPDLLEKKMKKHPKILIKM